MLPSIQPDQTQAWKKLEAHFRDMKNKHLRDLFREEPERFSKFSLCLGEIVFDYSKNLITDQTLTLLEELANECGLSDAIRAMYSGERINRTENRQVLHTALRNFSGPPVMADGRDVMPDVKQVLSQMRDCCERIHNGSWTGYTGKKIRYIVNIGIGGSDLGPVMVTEALKPYWKEDIQVYFVSNVDGTHIAETLKKVTADETLFLIASKT
ncbi:MAG TPA: glucose-6-phosphate isomerase, partial [Chitinophagaceae bacterium]|nr:glucose-6-phosphate isomerase [Chitinophagaceae bacterium]